MKRYIKTTTISAAAKSYQLYQNKYNDSKYIEVRSLPDGHTEYRSFSYWNTDKGPVKNYYTSKSNKGRWHRGSQRSIAQIIEDYELVESIEDGVKSDYNYVGSTQNPNAMMKNNTPVYLTYSLENFLQDVAQTVGPFDYADFLDKIWTKDSVAKLKNFKRRWDYAGEQENEDKLIQIGAEIDKFLKTIESN